MSMTDPVSDLLARIRNAGQARHAELVCPSSKLKLAVAKVLVDNGFLDTVAVEAQGGKPVLRIRLRYGPDGRSLIDGMRRVSKPSRRSYVDVKRIPRVRRGLGIAVLSTPRGVLSDREAREQKVGGEVVCEVW
jgi:small subunit ribosomal protein S8